jgi:hypothetical protein
MSHNQQVSHIVSQMNRRFNISDFVEDGDVSVTEVFENACVEFPDVDEAVIEDAAAVWVERNERSI